jgi:hypothetical protein
LAPINCTINYHPGKANVFVDALSRKTIAGSIFAMFTMQKELLLDLERAGVEMMVGEIQSYISSLTLELTLMEEIRTAQLSNDKITKSHEEVEKGVQSDFHVAGDGIMKFRNRVCITNDAELKRVILSEAHQSLYTVHPGNTKMYRDLRKNYWWKGMKKDIAQYVEQCLTCQQIKVEHQKRISPYLPVCLRMSGRREVVPYVELSTPLPE